jgi:hypothetical protein
VYERRGGCVLYFKKDSGGIGRYFGGGLRPQCYRHFTGCVGM